MKSVKCEGRMSVMGRNVKNVNCDVDYDTKIERVNGVSRNSVETEFGIYGPWRYDGLLCRLRVIPLVEGLVPLMYWLSSSFLSSSLSFSSHQLLFSASSHTLSRFLSMCKIINGH